MVLLIKKLGLYFILLLSAIIIVSCLKNKKPGIPIDVQKSLNKSGIRKPHLMSVILEFNKPEDSIKLHATYSLIVNLENNYSIRTLIYDSNGRVIGIDPMEFLNYRSFKKYKDSVKLVLEKISYKTDTILLDSVRINSEFIINHINCTYNSWQNGEWDTVYDFNTYCNFIFPYRVTKTLRTNSGKLERIK